MSESGSHKKKQKDHHDYHDGESSALNEKLLEGCKNGDLAEVRKLLEIEEVDVNYRKTTNISFEVTISKVCQSNQTIVYAHCAYIVIYSKRRCHH